MSIDLVNPPPNPSPEDAVHISQLAPKFLKNTPKPAAWPWSLISGDPPAETYIALETLYVQCLRTGDDKSAKDILDRLIARFGGSNNRVMAYQGMWEEARAVNEKDVIRVLEIYAKILEDDPSNLVSDARATCPALMLTLMLQPVHKRQIAVLKSMGNTQEAITQLVGFLDASPTDAEAWAELADLYLSQGLTEQAIFSLEEVLICQPNSWNVRNPITHFLILKTYII